MLTFRLCCCFPSLGELSGSQKQRENYFSAALLVAHYGEPGFDGDITYNADEDGDPITGFGPQGVEVYAAGTRNPFDVVLHSNGYLYGTENGPNGGFGKSSAFLWHVHKKRQ